MPRIGYARINSSPQGLEDPESTALRGRVQGHTLRDQLRHLPRGPRRVAGRSRVPARRRRTGRRRCSRLGRSTRDVLNLVHELNARSASLRVLEPEVTTAGDLGRLVVTVLGMVADMELKLIRDRQRAGIDAAKKKGNLQELAEAGRRGEDQTERSREGLESTNRPEPRGIEDVSLLRPDERHWLDGIDRVRAVNARTSDPH